MNISSVSNLNLESMNKVQNEAQNKSNSQADEVKNIQKARLNRQVMKDPSLAAKIVALESTMVYNSSAELIQGVSASRLTD
ncbi:MAG: hypothetical protein ACLFT1_08600 [Desulfonatronovibrio sp.]